MFVGIDDTDSAQALCTTYLLTEIIRELKDFDVIGYPKLVRLNPNIPWKTRGNAALAVRIGHGLGKPQRLGMIDGREVLSYSRFEDLTESEYSKAFEIVKALVEKYAQVYDENTNPGLVVSRKRPPRSLYWNAVRRVVRIDEVKRILDDINADYLGYKNSRGIIGAASALSWIPRDITYEIIAYRSRDKWGTQRFVDRESVKEMDRKYPSTFNNYDYEIDRPIIAPHSPCPILFGIRGDNPFELEDAMNMIVSEEKDRWIIYASNQGTDEHIERKKICELQAYTSARVSGEVISKPMNIRGGHVIFSISDGRGRLECAAYEPTKSFREIVRKLRIGDKVEVMGGIREVPFTLNIEKMRIMELAEVMEKVANPVCKRCGKRMHSIGTNAGFRCKRCGDRLAVEDAEYRKVEREVKVGWYEVPVSARRHLSKPLCRGLPK